LAQQYSPALFCKRVSDDLGREVAVIAVDRLLNEIGHGYGLTLIVGL
jgi:hypothetical protein